MQPVTLLFTISQYRSTCSLLCCCLTFIYLYAAMNSTIIQFKLFVVAEVNCSIIYNVYTNIRVIGQSNALQVISNIIIGQLTFSKASLIKWQMEYQIQLHIQTNHCVSLETIVHGCGRQVDIHSVWSHSCLYFINNKVDLTVPIIFYSLILEKCAY